MGTVSGNEAVGGMIGTNSQSGTSTVVGYSMGAVSGNSAVGSVLGVTTTDDDLLVYFDILTTGPSAWIGDNRAGTETTMRIHGISIATVSWNASQGTYLYAVNGGAYPVFHLAGFAEHFTVTAVDPGDRTWPELRLVN